MVMLNFEGKSLKESLEMLERELIRDKLIRTNWNQTRACDELVIDRKTMRKKIKEYGLTR